MQLSRDLDVPYKTAFVLSHKLREAMATETADAELGGTVKRWRAPTPAATSGRAGPDVCGAMASAV